YAQRFAMVDEVRLVDDGLDDLLKRSDVVVSCAPHTPKSRGMLGTEQFAAMKQGAYFLNVSRGKLVKTDALLDALGSGHLGGAGPPRSRKRANRARRWRDRRLLFSTSRRKFLESCYPLGDNATCHAGTKVSKGRKCPCGSEHTHRVFG